MKQHRIHPEIQQRALELRKSQTPAEQKLWNVLRDRRLCGYKFRRQTPISRFIVDFYCHEARLVVEVDGDVHAGQVEYDAERTEWLEAYGYRVIRVTNQDVLYRLNDVLEFVLEACKNAPPEE